MDHGQSETGKNGLPTHSVLVLLTMNVGEQRKLVAPIIEELFGGKARTGLGVARITQEQLETALREKREVLVLQMAHGIEQMFAIGRAVCHRKSRVEIGQ